MKTCNLMIYAVLLSLFTSAGFAESRRDTGSQDPMRKAQLMMRQLSQAKAQLEAENARLGGELKTAQQKLGELEGKLEKTSSRLTQSKADGQKLAARVRNDHEKMQNLIEKYRNTVQLLRMEKANVAHLTNAVQERNDWVDKCKANNESLYEASLELVDRYQNKGVWEEVTQAEPFTGLGDVKVEVIADEYRYRLEDLQVPRFRDEES